jgi:hypothetical protein
MKKTHAYVNDPIVVFDHHPRDLQDSYTKKTPLIRAENIQFSAPPVCFDESFHLIRQQSKKPKTKLLSASHDISQLTSCSNSRLDLHDPLKYSEIDTSNWTTPSRAEDFEEAAKSIRAKISLATSARKRD